MILKEGGVSALSKHYNNFMNKYTLPLFLKRVYGIRIPLKCDQSADCFNKSLVLGHFKILFKQKC